MKLAYLVLSASLFSVALSQFIPVVDIAELKGLDRGRQFCQSAERIVNDIHKACTTSGFFYVKGHGVSEELQNQLVDYARTFFSLPLETKRSIDMKLGGKAWRGFFAVGEEVTSGIPDQKEGIYYGTEISEYDPRPLHGANLWLEGSLGEGMKEAVLAYMGEMKALGQLLMKAISCKFSLPNDDFLNQFEQPTELFRIFNYPPHNNVFPANSFGVGEHTDYGYLTILKQDNSGGLQVKSPNNTLEWIDAPPVDGTFVINLGDALEHATDGIYRATPHRVLQRTHASSDRMSMPYFFDPSFDAKMQKVALLPDQLGTEEVAQRLSVQENIARRWDGMDPRLFDGTYGNYVLRKVSRAFPELFAEVVDKNSNPSLETEL